MRIISGRFKGRSLKMPKGIRPTQNMVRKALFDILSVQIAESAFLELFSGSASIGLEALSYGAKEVVLVENNSACLKVLRENIKSLQLEKDGLGAKVSVLVMDAFQALEFLAKNKKKFDIVFLDPPYYKDLGNKLLKKMADCDILFANAVVVAQHHKNDLLTKEAGFLKLFRQKRYGDSLLTFYGKE